MCLQDCLDPQTTQVSFVPCGRNDILTKAIGKPEHPSRVHTLLVHGHFEITSVHHNEQVAMGV